jgi:oligo-alginate lyase
MKTALNILLIVVFCTLRSSFAQHPSIFLTSKGVKEIKTSLGKYPVFDKSYNDLKKIADAALVSKIEVPVPTHGGGGYTHEKHKNNYYQMNACGIIYQISSDKKYATFVQDMLLQYADLYAKIGMHPIKVSEVRGKLFWQSLNDAVWLFHTANAYDCVYNFMSAENRQMVESKLFRPAAEFLSNGNEANFKTFNKMHNHGTWSQAAVGMIGYAMNDKDLIDKALFGSKKDGKTGFFSQLDVLFSPDGYFTEGPYYQRYSIWPFMVFAQVIENNQPELNIFEKRNGILFKAVNVLIQSSYKSELFYLNDALEKTLSSQEVVYAVDIAFKNKPENTQLLDIAKMQGVVTVTAEGLATAKALKQTKKIPAYNYASSLFTDGQNGDNGGIAILRKGKNTTQTCFTLKATSHGLSHGHYDKLSISLYDNGNSILTDYGASRFLNIEPKSGGGYTEENHTWAHQTIAHNTVTVDQRSHFNGDVKESSKYHSNIQYFDASNPNVQVVSASEANAYKGVFMQRTSAMISFPDFEFPIIVDLYRLQSKESHTYDYPFYYRGQKISTDFQYTKSNSELKALGTSSGYQHLWLEATAKAKKENAKFTWYNGNRFYSITTATDTTTNLMLTRIGANDPDFNLRNEAAFIVRQPNATNHTFASIIEPHGLYDLVKEVTVGFKSNVESLKIIVDNDQYTAMKFEMQNSKKYIFISLNSDFDSKKQRTITLNDKKMIFNGNYHYEDIK